jgi:anti-sigma regulatory factor (Ser/Thr protein kinase)
MSKIELAIDSCYEDIDLIGTCIDSLASEFFDDEQRYQIKICVYEAITNCVKHAYQDSYGHKIWVNFEILADRIQVDIADYGLPINPHLLDDTTTSFQLDPENPAEGGMGLKLIKLFMDVVRCQNQKGVNHLTLVKYFKLAN